MVFVNRKSCRAVEFMNACISVAKVMSKHREIYTLYNETKPCEARGKVRKLVALFLSKKSKISDIRCSLFLKVNKLFNL